MSDLEWGFPGKAFSDLRPDQRRYVSHLMKSWRAANNEECWFSRSALNRAVKKARNNHP